MIKPIFTLLHIFISLSCIAQNLVPNNGFEFHLACPPVASTFNLAFPWLTPTFGTSDLHDACHAGGIVGVPNNFIGNQGAYQGNAYGGFYCNSVINPSSGNEYGTVALNTTLMAGHCYYAEMYASLADFSKFGYNKLGMLVTNGIPSPGTPAGVITNTPQVCANQIITDKNGWVKINGIFKASGGENYLTIGNFFTLGQAEVVYVGGVWDAIYYYIDEVYLAELDSVSQPISFTICEGECVEVGTTQYCTAGVYTLDNSICPGNGATTINVITVPMEQVIIATPVPDISCNNPIVTLDASASTGLNPGNFYWSGPNDFYENASIVNIEQPGMYVFNVINSAGCISKDSVLVAGDISSPNITFVPVPSWDCMSSTITLQGQSSTPNVTYHWTGPGINATTPSVDVSQSGTYTLVVTGANNCTTYATYPVPDDYFYIPQPFVPVTDILNCNNSFTYLIGSADRPNVTYLWTGPGINSTNPSVQVNQPGIYTFTVTSAIGCSNSLNVEVFQNLTPPDVETSINSDLVCESGIITLEGTSNTPNVAYQWTGPGLFENVSMVSVSEIGTYVLSVSALDNGCTSTSIIDLTETELGIPTIIDIDPPGLLGCSNGFVTLYAETNIAGSTFLWTGPGLNDPNQSSSTNIGGIFTLLVTAPNGCTMEESVEVLEDASGIDLQITGGGFIDCLNPDRVLTGSSSIPNLTYTWTGPGMSEIGQSIIASIVGNYTVVATNESNGCSATESILIQEYITFPVSHAGDDGTLDCQFSTYTLDGVGSMGFSLSFEWFDLNGSLLSTDTTLTVSQSDNYILQITNTENGCTDSDTVSVFQDTMPPSALAGLDEILDCSTPTITLDGSNSVGNNLTYVWYNSQGDSLGNAVNLTINSPDIYTLIITNSTNGCSSQDEVEITQNADVPTANAGLDEILDCSTPTITLDGSNSVGNNLTWLLYQT